MTKHTFPSIDNSHWRVKDRDWVTARKEKWAEIEPRIRHGLDKSARAMPIIKRYFMKGEVADFEGLLDWMPISGHLDLFLFIWLHPSRDKPLLERLRDEYIAYEWVKKEDVEIGLGILIVSGTTVAGESWLRNKKRV